MLCKNTLVAILMILPLTVWAGGRTEDGEFRPVDGAESWEYTFDLGDYEPGTYNLLVRARDQAGNESLEGPINVTIDPESDRPTLSISNPSPDAPVGAVLTILGTARDDDRVQSVEVQLDDRPTQIADGTDFWSLALDLSKIEDGPHRITAVAIDEGGVRSIPVTVDFHLDKRGPSVRLDSHQSGSLVNGRIRVRGTASDPNGIASIDLGVGDMDALEPVGIGRRAGDPHVEFEAKIDTRERADGPLILWYRSTDETGSQTIGAFLLFADNEPATLTILSPDEDSPQNGMVTVFGTVTDAVGVQSLRYEASHGPAGEIPIVPGDPYWSVPIDLSDAGRSTRLTFTAIDATGNETEIRRSIPIDSDRDRPQVRLLWPSDQTSVSGELALVGSITDDDAPRGVEVTVDRGEPVRFDTTEVFRIPLPELGYGPHRISVRGVDVNGVVGPAEEITVTLVPPSPEIVLLDRTVDEETVPYAPGFAVYTDESVSLGGRVSEGVTSVRYGLGEPSSRAPLSESDEGNTFTIPIPRRLPPGRHVLSIRASDEYGGTVDAAALFYVLERAPDEPEEGVSYFTAIPRDTRVDIVDPRHDSGRVVFSRFAPFRFFVPAGDVRAAALEPESSAFSVSTDGPVVTVTPVEDSVSGPHTIELELDDGTTLSAGPFTLTADANPPVIGGLDELAGSIVADSVETELSAGPNASPVEISLDGGETFVQPQSRVLSVGGEADGPILVLARATDEAGNETLGATGILKDSVAPKITFVTPRTEDSVNGTITVGGLIEDATRPASLSVHGPEGMLQELPSLRTFSTQLDLVGFSESQTVRIVARDRAGNVTESDVPMSIDQAGDKPVVDLQLPLEGTVIREDAVASGMVFDDDAVKSVLVRINDGEWQAIGDTNSFRLPLSLDDLGDNEHTLTVKAVDIGGTESDPVTRSFFASTQDPVVRLDSPDISTTNRGVVRIEGRASDANGIGAVELSFDNGVSFQSARLTEDGSSWSYELDTTMYADGLHSVQLRVVDAYGTEALYSSLLRVDNAPPDIALDTPADGVTVSELLELSGRVEDAGTLDRVALRLVPLPDGTGGDGPGITRDSQTAAVITEAIATDSVLQHSTDLSSVSPGWYNLEITAVDTAENESSVSRNITIASGGAADSSIVVTSPADGSTVVGPVVVSGYVKSATPIRGVVIRTDERILGTADPDERGRFLLELPDGLDTGTAAIVAEAELVDGTSVASADSRVTVSQTGPWVTVDSHYNGDFLTNRPFLRGRSGVALSPAPDIDPESREYRAFLQSRQIESIEVSLDNGRSFAPASGVESWRYRVETGELTGESLEVVVRARTVSGEVTSVRRLYFLDGAAPSISLTTPDEGVTANESLLVTGRAADENGSPDVAVILRPGDKSRYSVPAFIQGLYLDVHVLGATTFDVGAGLTFFDDNVKLQAQVGTSPVGRFFGTVMGAKLLANVATLPMSYLFGPDWDFLSLSVAVGANFSYFTMSEGFSPDGLVLGGMVGQIEFPTFAFARRTALNKLSFYTEGQLWFISSDVNAGVNTRLSFGTRIGLF